MSKTALLGSTAPFTGAEEPQKRGAQTTPAPQQSAPRGHRPPKQRPRRRRDTGSDDGDDGGGDGGGDPPASRVSKIYLTAAQLRKRWGGCSHMFIERRLQSDPKMPRPMKLGGRVRLFDLDAIENYERSRIYAGGDEAA